MNLNEFRGCVSATLEAHPKSGYLSYLLGLEDPDLSSVIMVEIPSYRDPEIVPTVKSLLGMAANPDRILFSICLQDDDPDTMRALREMYGKVLVRHYHPEETPGLCAARYECHKLSKGRCDYVFRTDSHMRAARYWDTALIAILKQCPGKAMLSAYGPDYAKLLGEDPCSDAFTARAEDRGAVTNGYYFQEKMPKLRFGVRTYFKGSEPRRGAFIGGAFVFGPASLNDEVPSDPDMFAQGDELPVSLRLFTHGWDVYHPQYRFLYHLYSRQQVLAKTGVDIPLDEDNDFKRVKLAREAERFDALFWKGGIDFGPFGNGTDRTPAEFCEFAGIDVRKMSLRTFTASGYFDVPHGPEDLAFFDWCAYARKSHLRLGPKEHARISDPALAARFSGFCLDNGILPEIGLQKAMELFAERRGRADAASGGRNIVLVGENHVSRSFLSNRRIGPRDAVAGCIRSFGGIQGDGKGLPKDVRAVSLAEARSLDRPLFLLCTWRWKEAYQAAAELAGYGYAEFEDVLQWQLYGRKTAIRWGNCHADYVADFLALSKPFSDAYAFYMMPSLWNLKSGNDIPAGLMGRVSLCIGQPIRNDNSVGPFASSEYVRSRIPADAKVLTFPNLRGLTTPLYAQFAQSLSELVSTGYSRVPKQNFLWFRDRIIEDYLASHPGADAAGIHAAYLDADIDADAAAEAYAKREASYRAAESEHCTLGIFDFIDAHMRTEQLFIDPEHPSRVLLEEIGNRVLDALGMPRIHTAQSAMRSYGHGVPMHPKVKSWMGYSWDDDDIKGMNPVEKYGRECMDLMGYIEGYLRTRSEFLG